MPVAEVVVLASGALGFVASLLPWYRGGFSVFGFGGSVEVNAWEAGAGAWLSTLGLVAAALVVLLAGATARRPASGWCWPAVLGLSIFSVVCLVARWLSWPGPEDGGLGGLGMQGSVLGGLVSASAGPGVGFYLGIFATGVTVATAVWRARAAPGPAARRSVDP
jgi:hypothetical protein